MAYTYGSRRARNEKSCNLYIIRAAGDTNFLKSKTNERAAKVINLISRELVNFKVIIFSAQWLASSGNRHISNFRFMAVIGIQL